MASPKMTATDISWSIGMAGILMSCMIGGMFVAATYVTPAVLHSPNSEPRVGAAKAVEAFILFGGMAIGDLTALVILGLVSRRFLDAKTHDRWSQQLKNGQLPLPYRKVGEVFLGIIRPRNSDAI